MVEAFERDLLLALMRRLRRRRRWTLAVEGAAMATGLVAAAAAVILAAARLVGDVRLGAGGGLAMGLTWWLVLVLGIGAGAVIRGSRKISLEACAREVDRVACGPQVGTGPAAGVRVRARAHPTDDTVLAAVSLAARAAPEGTPPPFVRALMARAVDRTKLVPANRAVAPPRGKLLLSALGALVMLAAVVVLPQSLPRAAMSSRTKGREKIVGAPDDVRPLRFVAASLGAERDDATDIVRAAEANADIESTRTARELQRLIGELSGDGLDARLAVARLESLARNSDAAAAVGSVAKTADAAARRALEAAQGVGGRASTLASILAASDDQDARAGAQAASGLAEPGQAGQRALGNATAAAAAALALPADGDAGKAADEEQSRRRLARGTSEGQEARDDSSTEGDARPSEARRHLETLRRDLENEATECRHGTEDCRRGAESAARALSELNRQGRTAETRRRLRETVRQLLERIRRETPDERNQRGPSRRFARAARGDDQRTSTPARVGHGASASDTNAPQTTVGASGEHSGDNAGDEGASAGMDESAATASTELPDVRDDTPGSGRGDSPPANADGHSSAGAAIAAGGIGTTPGGPVLGPRTPPDAGGVRGHDAPVALMTNDAGASRAQVIRGAAARGFATLEYKSVFADYRAALEESLDATAVPAGRRYLVRRYFQLIRPRPTP